MHLHKLKIKDSLNKAYLKLPPTRSQIETFKENFLYLFKQVKESEGEEYHKNEISEFLKKTYYSPDHYINAKGRFDLVIHNGKDSNSSVGVIVETKSPGSVSEMPTVDNINAKAVRELILYFLRERIINKNLELKHLIATNLHEWFIFDAHEFEKHIAGNKNLIKQFTDFEEGRLSGKDTSFFYNSVAAPFLESLEAEIKFTHFDLRDHEPIVRNNNQDDDALLIPLYKILSPEHLLKLQFKNDSNSLDKDFYRELLHIIGLEETKQGSKKLIGRGGEKTRNHGSMIESAISILHTEDFITQVPRPADFGETKEEQLFNISLELVITWINRILFLKLLEGQLVKYNLGDKSFKFLDQSVIPDYDALNKLFFHILAIPEAERDERLKERFSKIPYLNSSLFEPTDLERKTIRISNIDDDNKLPLHKSTILKDSQGKRITGDKNTLDYLFEFLDAYNFSSDGGKGIQEENKTLINASVLGLIFEKINGYKDGSFFTPGFITQYMCHETITRAVVQKFHEVKGWNCESLIDINNKIEDKQEANKIINSLRICDPAVGSGHFLVSALNEILSIKSELKILMDHKGRVLRDYHFEVINDELIISDPDGEPFEYNPKNHESQRVQEAIFHEKQTIIENCLFGVDINPNSVRICRLRLWIELLKHAYYKPDTKNEKRETRNAELETLPNIDINIKCGNSLISRYPLDADIRTALKSSKWTVDNYREAVMTYRNAETKEQKRAMEKLIKEIKSNFESEVSKSDKRFLKLNRLKGELLSLTTQTGMFDMGKKEKEEWNKKVKKLADEQLSIEQQLEEIRNNKIYESAFEWRFEFPEVLNNGGDFVGFDIIIGNPPYIPLENFSLNERSFFNYKFSTLERKYESSVMFIIEGFEKLKCSGLISYIAPITWQTGENYSTFRKWVFNNYGIYKIINLPFDIFEDAYVETAIYSMTKKHTDSYKIFSFNKKDRNINLENIDFLKIPNDLIVPEKYKVIMSPIVNKIIKRLNSWDFVKLGDITISTQGLSGSQFPPSTTFDMDTFLFLAKGNVYNYLLIKKETYFTSLKELQSLKQFYEANQKILIRRIINRQNRLSIGYTEERLVLKKDINPFVPNNEDFSAKYLLAIMASKLISFLYINLSSIATKDDFRQTTLTELRELPIPKISKEKQQLFIDHADKILNLKMQNLDSDTSELERGIDQLVYKLYGLTDEEIDLVEAIN